LKPAKNAGVIFRSRTLFAQPTYFVRSKNALFLSEWAYIMISTRSK